MDTSNSITASDLVAVPPEGLELDALVDSSEDGSRGLEATKATRSSSDDRPLGFELFGNHSFTGQVTGLAQILLQGPPHEILEQPSRDKV
jgi:hypothetical protein